MTGQDFYEAWRGQGALVICKHDHTKTGLTFSALFEPSGIPEAAHKLLDAGYHLEGITAAQVKEGFLVTWHFNSFTSPGRLAVRAVGQKNDFWSINSIFQGAEWHEREQTDFFGITFAGNHNPVPLLLPHDFPLAPPLLKEEKALASLMAFNLFGEAEALDPDWQKLLAPVAEEQKEGAA